jgi:hypothetical protein
MLPNPFWSKLIDDFYRGKRGAKLCDSFVFFNKLPKDNNRSIGENAANLVALIATTFVVD